MPTRLHLTRIAACLLCLCPPIVAADDTPSTLTVAQIDPYPIFEVRSGESPEHIEFTLTVQAACASIEAEATIWASLADTLVQLDHPADTHTIRVPTTQLRGIDPSLHCAGGESQTTLLTAATAQVVLRCDAGESRWTDLTAAQPLTIQIDCDSVNPDSSEPPESQEY